jgi:microcompartment protein CcmL/EutN
VRGEIGAVQASVDAGVTAAKKAGQLIAGHVIARPHRFTEAIIHGGDNKVIRALAD